MNNFIDWWNNLSDKSQIMFVLMIGLCVFAWILIIIIIAKVVGKSRKKDVVKSRKNSAGDITQVVLNEIIDEINEGIERLTGEVPLDVIRARAHAVLKEEQKNPKDNSKEKSKIKKEKSFTNEKTRKLNKSEQRELIKEQEEKKKQDDIKKTFAQFME